MQPGNVDIVAKGFCCDGKVVCEVVQAHADHLIGFISDWSDVDILALIVAPDQFAGDFNQLVNCVGERYLKNLARTKQPLVVLAKTEQIQLLILLVPIAPNALEASGAIGEAMGAY